VTALNDSDAHALTARGAPDPARRWLERLPVAQGRPVLGVAATLALVTAAWALRWAADPVLPPGFPYVTFFPAVIVTSFLFGVRLGALSALLCGLIAWQQFIPPAGFALSRASAIALAFYAFVVATDIVLVHWMQRANRKLAAERETNRVLADMRELLFQELQHRVSNNLQVAAALLALQRREITDPTARTALTQTAQRLELIGRISRQLYDASGGAQPLLPLLDGIARSVIEASGRADVSLTIAGDATVRLSPDVTMPTALITAEAVANAIEHGFADNRAGAIAIEVDDRPDAVAITIADDGHGLPATLDPATSGSLGLRIARMMAEAQGGRFTLARAERTEAVLTLPSAR
jgi:two-component sensor histidine kinase